MGNRALMYRTSAQCQLTTIPSFPLLPAVTSVVSSQSHRSLGHLIEHLARHLFTSLTCIFIFQRAYILLYLGMALLSLTTVVLSLVGDCPPFAFYVLEVVVNTVMILEVTTRVVAFGEVNPPRIFAPSRRSHAADGL